jgi:dTDP-4-dehydrorhamnose reductase
MDKSKKILLFGGSGQLGSQMCRLWSDLHVTAPSRSEIDVEDRAAVERAVAAADPDVVINCTAYNDVVRAESEPERAFAVNAFAVDSLSRICAGRDCTFVTFSTDYVFDGTQRRPYVEGDAPNPATGYGISKLAGELLTLRRASPAFVIRTCGVYGTRVSSSKGYTFIDRIIAQAKAGEPVRIVDDQVVSPTYAGDLAVAVRALLEANPEPGIYHAVNEGAVSWYEFACETLRQAGIEAAVTRISSREFGSAVRRPAYSALENAKLNAIGLSLPDWRSGIAAYLRDRREIEKGASRP